MDHIKFLFAEPTAPHTALPELGEWRHSGTCASVGLSCCRMCKAGEGGSPHLPSGPSEHVGLVRLPVTLLSSSGSAPSAFLEGGPCDVPAMLSFRERGPGV